jgi:hypothetical protein
MFKPCYHSSHVKWVHCHNGMARPWVANRGDGLQTWTAAVNIVNKESRNVQGAGGIRLKFTEQSHLCESLVPLRLRSLLES